MGKSLNLLFFGHSAGLGGAERSLLGLVDDAVKRGAECTVILPQHGQMERLLLDVGARVAVMPLSWWCGDSRTSPEAISRGLGRGVLNFFADVVPFARSVKPDVIVTQTMVIPWGAAVAALLGKPHIWSVCEYGELDHGLQFVEPIANITGDMDAAADYFFFASQDAGKVLFPNLASDRGDALYAYIEIDENAPRVKSGTRPVVGLFGTLSPTKGQVDAIDAIAELKARGTAVELVLAGPGPAGYLRELKQRVQAQGVDELVRFTGLLENPFPEMRACDVVLVCSRREAFGRTAPEAMLMSKPVVYAASGGIAEYMQDGATGLAYPFGDSKALADRIETLVRDGELAASIGNAAKIFALTTFTRENYGGKFYAKALELRGTPTRARFPELLLASVRNASTEALSLRKQARSSRWIYKQAAKTVFHVPRNVSRKIRRHIEKGIASVALSQGRTRLHSAP